MKKVTNSIFILTVLLFFVQSNNFILARDTGDSHSNNALSKLNSATDEEAMRINDDTGETEQENPEMAMSRYGYPVICWQDSREGNKDIYVQLFNYKGVKVKTNIKVNDDAGTVDQTNPDIAMDNRGHFVVVWEDARNGNTDIYAQLYEANGEPIGANFKVNDDDTPPIGKIQPAVAVDGIGNFVVCWTDTRNGANPFIYAQRFNRAGEYLGANFVVNATNSVIQIVPAIDMTESGNFVIVWNEPLTTAYHDVYAQRFDPDGTPQGDKFEVSEHPDQQDNTYDPDIALQQNGDFIVFWSYALAGEKQNIYGRMYQADGTPYSAMFIANEIDERYENQEPAAYADPITGDYILVWSQYQWNWNLMARIFDNSGAIILDEIVTDINRDQKDACVAVDCRNNYIIAWEDDQEKNFDIYANWFGEKIVLNVTAGSGFDGIVPLTWDPMYGYEEIVRYSIYRSTTPGGSYTKIKTVAPNLRPFPELMLDWIDTDVVNGTTYYYQIDCDDADYPSVEVSATPSATGYVIQSGWAIGASDINGEIEAGEWDDATAVNIANPHTLYPVTLYIKNSYNTLYIAVDDPNDDIINPQNILGILFDEDHNGEWDAGAPSNEGVITINSTSAYFTGFWGEYPEDLGADIPITSPATIFGISTISGHVQYEAAFDMTVSPISATPGQTIGAAFWISDPGNSYPYHYGNTGEWPAAALWEAAQPLGDLIFAVESDTIPIDTTVTFDWPMVNGNKERTSWAKDETDLYPPFIYSYEYLIAGKTAANISFLDRTLLVGTESNPNTVYAFDYESPTELWDFDIPGTWGAIGCTPAINDSLVFFGGQDGPALYALDRWNGAQSWRKDIGSLYLRNPVIDEDRIYIIKDSLYCINSEDGATVWSFYSPAANGTPTVDCDNVYFVASGQLFAIDKMTGAIKWHVTNKGYSIVTDNQHIYSCTSDSIVARHKTDGSVVWYYTISGVSSAGTGNIIAINDNYLCVSVWATGHLYTLNKSTGAYRWQYTFDNVGVSTPTIANGVVYVVNGDPYEVANGALWGFELETTTVVFFDDTEDYRGQPIIANHTMFVAAEGKVNAFSNTVSSIESAANQNSPQEYRLAQNYPNPFNPETLIQFRVQQPCCVVLKVYDLLGREVAKIVDKQYPAGQFQVNFDASQLTSGVYFYQIQMGNFTAVRKMVLLQ